MTDRKEYFRKYMASYRAKIRQKREPAPPKVVKTPAERMKEYRLRKKMEKSKLEEFNENVFEMSLGGELQHPEILRTEVNHEPFKKRFKAQVTAADLCKVVIDNNSSEEEELSDDADDLASSEEDQSGSDYDSSEESESDTEELSYIKLDLFEQPLTEQARAEYEGVTGLRIPPLGPQPRDYFNLVMNKSMYSLIIKNTNAYAKDGNDASVSSWKTLKEDEMKKFLGLLFLMGVIKLPDISLYWSTEKLFNFPSFREIMSMDRFLSILHALSFCDESVSDVADPLRKIRPLIEFFNILMESIFVPQKELVMSNPMKISNGTGERGIQVFTLSEPSGMVQKYLIRKRTRVNKTASHHKRSVIAKDLLEGKLGKGHSVFIGDYFTTVPLVQSLKADNTYGTGQLSERNCICDILTTPVNDEGVLQRFTDDGVCLVKWKGKRKDTVYVSSEFDGSLNKASNYHGVEKLKPSMFLEFDRLMRGGTKTLEELISSYPAGKKRIKWFKKVGLQILNIALLNSYHLYCRYNHTKDMGLLKFRLNLIRSLLYPSTEVCDTTVSPENATGYSKPHVLDYVGRNDKGFRKRKRCKYCISERGVRVDSYYHCITCDNQPGFCLGQCFIKYHKYDLLL